MIAVLKRLWTDEEGQGLVEYGLIIALVAILLVGGLLALTGALDGIFESISGTLEEPEATQ